MSRARSGGGRSSGSSNSTSAPNPSARLAAKLDRYAQLAAATHPTPVLFWLPSPRREAHAREHLTRALRQLERPDLVPVATTTPTWTTR